MLPPGVIRTVPLPPFSSRCRISSSTCMFQAKSYSPVWMTARAADTASPPPFISIGVEVRPVGDVVVGIELAPDDVARLEVDEPVGPGADRLEVGRRVARLGADVVGEQVLRDDHAARADEGVGPERRRLGEADASPCGRRPSRP